jgi:molecular chaperone DnaK
VSAQEAGEPVLPANTEGSRTTSSVVACAKNCHVPVGLPAKNHPVTNVDRTTR